MIGGQRPARFDAFHRGFDPETGSNRIDRERFSSSDSRFRAVYRSANPTRGRRYRTSFDGINSHLCRRDGALTPVPRIRSRLSTAGNEGSRPVGRRDDRPRAPVSKRSVEDRPESPVRLGIPGGLGRSRRPPSRILDRYVPRVYRHAFLPFDGRRRLSCSPWTIVPTVPSQ